MAIQHKSGQDSQDVVHLQHAVNLVLRLDTPKGRGVYAEQGIKAGEVVDVSPVLVLPAHENNEHIEKTCLYHYTYNWPVVVSGSDSTVETRQAVVFGLGSMFNHSRDQNVGWSRDTRRLTIIYRALRDIPAGEELCISYGSRLTFEDVDVGADTQVSETENDGLRMLTQINIA